MAASNLASMLDTSEPIPLSSRFAKLKRNMIACREKDVAESFYRLLRALRKEADDIAARGSDVIPTIDYFDIHDSGKASAFRKALRRRGVAVIKRVVPHTVAQTWKEEALDYIADNPQSRGYPPHDPQLFDLYWSPSQVRARVDSRLLDAQRFAMRTWHASDEQALVSAEHPVAYADRLRVRTPGDTPLAGSTHVDNGSVERWEPDGYGASGTYRDVFSGRWEDYDPWDSSPRLHITTDLYNRSGSCSMFRMFQGFLSLSDVPEGSGALTVCPMLQLSTAYLLLRPFFTPRYKDPAARRMDGSGGMDMGMGAGVGRGGAALDFLHPNNWNLNVSQTSVLHGAVPGYVQELSSALHPHLQLNRTMVSIPDLEPGDYVIWHPDAVHAVDGAPSLAAMSSHLSQFSPHGHFNPNTYSPSSFSLNPPPPPPPPPSFSPNSNPFLPRPFSPSHYSHSTSSSRSGSLSSFTFGHRFTPSSSSSASSASSPPYPIRSRRATAAVIPNPYPAAADPTAAVLYIPACPLTQTNALYLARQRRAFLLGLAAPDFAEAGAGSAGERDHQGRPGVQDIADAGGERGLRSMGLAPWEEAAAPAVRPRGGGGGGSSDKSSREREKDARLLRLANGILFPDRFDGVLKKPGRR
ncbi:putative duf1479 domain protein [Rosellinia necatrix]|uniref:Putative duf1479 domain protein n=1 Tax=Rosellinia necatrix TaxID=77044 RepID=A0A1S7ULT9_ROSNE|nr:putative duf1479 domain protein [Rosellinia necatrix]